MSQTEKPVGEDGSDYGEAEVPMDPLVTLLHQRHTFTSEFSMAKDRDAAREAIIAAIRQHRMAPYYDMVKDIIGFTLPEGELKEMHEKNAARVVELEAKFKDAEENLGDTEQREALVAKCDFFAGIGDLAKYLDQVKQCEEKTLAVGPKLDLCFQRIRMGLAFSDHAVVTKAIADANELMKKGDWERRNRLKVYEGLFCVFVRNFEKGSKLLLDAATTFAATELLTFKEYILITAVAGLATLNRAGLREHVVDSPEVLSANIKEVNALVAAIHKCRYGEVFDHLASLCHLMRHSVFLTAHVNYFFREVRIRVFNQFLDSYSSVTLKSMAASFRLPVNVLDQMLFTLISNERLACKIDRVSGNVITYRGDQINFQYHRVVKEGDLLLNKIQKLSRVVEQ